MKIEIGLVLALFLSPWAHGETTSIQWGHSVEYSMADLIDLAAKMEGADKLKVSCVRPAHPVDRYSDEAFSVMLLNGEVVNCQLKQDYHYRYLRSGGKTLVYDYWILAKGVVFPTHGSFHWQSGALEAARNLVRDGICDLR